MEFPSIETLGQRIMICGPSNSGKSTLGQALGRKLGMPAVHLDLLYHLPHSNWVPRPKDEFVALHDAAIAETSWVMDGNYFATIQQRLGRATGIVLLGSEPVRSALRNVRRTLFESGRRAGQLEGNIDTLNWRLFHFILFEQPRKRQRDLEILRAARLPMMELDSMRELKALYAVWGLSRR
ncbi:MAG: AAA family ATPase [Hyphomicrobiales bacterium]|nr:MAG: AAA family ATPase [Hyphomicrobiales bacterium]